MRLLIPVFSPATGTWGGLTRVIAIAQAAIKAGHRVAFCASGYLRSTLQQRGFTVYPTPSTTLFGLPTPLSHVLTRRSQHATLPIRPGRDFGNIWFVLLLSGVARSGYLQRLVEAERHAAKDFNTDFLFTDLDPGAYLLARIDGLPIASAYQTPMAHGINSLPWKLLNRATSDVPLLIFPGPIFERRFNARKIKQAGAGLMGEVNEFTVEWINRALENQPAYALKALQLGERIRSYGGAKAAVKAMQDWSHVQLKKAESRF